VILDQRISELARDNCTCLQELIPETVKEPISEDHQRRSMGLLWDSALLAVEPSMSLKARQ